VQFNPRLLGAFLVATFSSSGALGLPALETR
jgi:hypothetical protein